ncbi:MAG: DNA methyltransferase, partial [Promethearchaeota archaeon]
MNMQKTIKHPTNEILKDLKILFDMEEIQGKELAGVLNQLKTSVVKDYLRALKDHAKPEDALKYYFFSKNSMLVQFLFKKLQPEIGGNAGYIDYLIKDGMEDIKLEIKHLFEAEFERGKSGERFKRIKKVKLNWRKYENQIKKYLGRKGEFLVFTNLEEWYFFSKNHSLDKDCDYFAKINVFELIKDFAGIGDFWQYLDRKEELVVKEPLDKKFFNSLKAWIEELRKVRFNVDEKKKTRLIIKLINKFIFIQTLDNFWIIYKNYLATAWSIAKKKWRPRGKLVLIEKFLEDLNEFFNEYYDTGLFGEKESILDYIETSIKNIDLFYNKLRFVLGVDFGTTTIGWERGVIQYNFRRIDEDILGKAYETFLAEIRREKGIYYTPRYITRYIIDKSVGQIYGDLLKRIKDNLGKEKFDACETLIHKFVSIRVLDPACGSGSFLIKALKLIWTHYNRLIKHLSKEEKKYSKFKDGLIQSEDQEKKYKRIQKLKDILNIKNSRDLVSKIMLRHVYGIDLDAGALEIAKINLWLESIKLIPSEFKHDRLPNDTNHILPDLKMNLKHGDSLIGLSEDLTIKFLKM